MELAQRATQPGGLSEQTHFTLFPQQYVTFVSVPSKTDLPLAL